MILGAAFARPLHFMARRSLFAVPGFGWLIRQTQAFPLNREGDVREAMRLCGALLEKDAAVVMFPEGTRSLDGMVGVMRPGVGMLAMRNLAPVLPVYIWGSFQSWPRGRKFPRPHRVKALIGRPIVPSGEGDARKEEQKRVTDAVGEAIRALEREAWADERTIPEKRGDQRGGERDSSRLKRRVDGADGETGQA